MIRVTTRQLVSAWMWKDVKRAITDNDSKWFTESDRDWNWEAPHNNVGNLIDIVIHLKDGEWKIV